MRDLDELERQALENLREYDILWQRGREPFLRIIAELASLRPRPRFTIAMRDAIAAGLIFSERPQ